MTEQKEGDGGEKLGEERQEEERRPRTGINTLADG
jgi:hypothetical protein